MSKDFFKIGHYYTHINKYDAVEFVFDGEALNVVTSDINKEPHNFASVRNPNPSEWAPVMSAPQSFAYPYVLRYKQQIGSEFVHGLLTKPVYQEVFITKDQFSILQIMSDIEIDNVGRKWYKINAQIFEVKENLSYKYI